MGPAAPIAGTSGEDGVLGCSYFHDGTFNPQIALTLLCFPDFAATTTTLRQHLPRKYRALISTAVAEVKGHSTRRADSGLAAASSSLSQAELLLVLRELHRSAAARFGDDIAPELNALLLTLSLEDEDDRQEQRDEQEASAREQLDLISLVGAFGNFDPVADSPPPTGYDERRALASTRLLI
jgi:hypothetical protein